MEEYWTKRNSVAISGCREKSVEPGNGRSPEKMAAALELPENEEVLMVMDLGYAAEGTGPLPNHTNRKAIEQTVTLMEQRC